MAAPVLTLINAGGLTDGVINNADTNTGWINLTTVDADIKVEGAASMSGVTRNDGEDSYYDFGSAPVTGVSKVLRGWVNTTNLPYMQLEAINPYELWVYDGTSQSTGLALFGSDTYPGGWFYFWQDMDNFVGVTLANIQRWGIEAGHGSSAKNVVNMWMDVLRYMDGYSFTGGTSGDKVTFLSLSSTDSLSAYGIVQNSFDVFFCTGIIQIGSGATTTFFESDGDVIIFRDMPGGLSISAGLYEINAQGSGCNCVIKNDVIRANGVGATTRFNLNFSDINFTLTFINNLIQRAGTVIFASGQSPTSNVFDDCGQITHAGADMTGCTIKNYEGISDTSALLYNVNADPDGKMDLMNFIKGTASTHAIEFGVNVPNAMTLRNIDFSGYNALDGQTDSTLYFADTAGTITVNLIGCTGNLTYKSAGATIVLVSDPVTVTITVKDLDTNVAIENARVFLEVTSGVNFPYQASVSITGTGTTATVSHTGHGLSTGDRIVIRGANEDVYNGQYEITVNNTDSYTYTTSQTIATSPATGTITSTFLILSALTNASGITAITRVYSSDQTFKGWIRKSTNSPYYRQGNLTDTINSQSGYSTTVLLSKDE